MRNVSCRGCPTAKAWKPLVCGPQPECWGLWETLALSHSLQVLGLLVWALIADTPYHLYPAYGWVMFVAVFLWLVTIVFFILYLFQLHMKLYMVPWPLVLMIFNVGATVLYITAFITCSASVELTSLKGTRQYNQRAAASFFSCLVMIAYGVSAFFSFQAWRGLGSNAATSQMAGGYA
eukprot:XP_028334166.1 plasmolipin [Physeter catodon]